MIDKISISGMCACALVVLLALTAGRYDFIGPAICVEAGLFLAMVLIDTWTSDAR